MHVQSIGLAGQTVYSMTATSDQKTLYVGLDFKNIKVFDLKANKLKGNFAKINFPINKYIYCQKILIK